MANLTLTLEQLTKIQGIGARLSRDPAFLASVENAIKELLPVASSATEQTGTEVPEVVSDGTPRVERTVSFGWSLPLNDDGTIPVATLIATQVGVFSAMSKAAVAGVSKE